VNDIQFALGGNTDVVPGSNGRTVAHITCFKCNKLGYFADFYSDGLESGKQYHMNVVKLEGGLTRNIPSNEGGTERNVDG